MKVDRDADANTDRDVGSEVGADRAELETGSIVVACVENALEDPAEKNLGTVGTISDELQERVSDLVEDRLRVREVPGRV
jgi:hypothetical protein